MAYRAVWHLLTACSFLLGSVCPVASHPYFCYSFAVHPNCETIHVCCCLLILHATTTCASRFIHCHSQRLEDPWRLAGDARSSYHVQTKCRKVSQTWICLTEHVHEKVTVLVGSGVVDTEELRVGRWLLLYRIRDRRRLTMVTPQV